MDGSSLVHILSTVEHIKHKVFFMQDCKRVLCTCKDEDLPIIRDTALPCALGRQDLQHHRLPLDCCP